jgi:timeless
MKLRENALKQADMILEYKRIICHHSSHHHRCRHHNHRTKGEDSSDEEGEEGGGILSIFVSLLAEPLSKTGTARTDHDHLAIELVLHLFRNLLSAEPLLQSTAEQSYRDQQLHNELISLLEQELVLEILLVLSADLEARENAPYNLLVLELVHHLLRGQDPAAVAKGNAVERASIQQALAREQPRKSVLSSRHGHFGGTLAVTTAAGRHRYVSASRIGEKRLVAAPIVTKRKHKRTDPFVGGSTSGAAADRLSRQARGGPAQVKAWNVLDRFCNRFFNDCYGAVLKSWKNEFRRDSVRLQQDDLVVLMRIVWFFMLWRRVKGKNELGPLLFTMDLFTFNLVLTATDTYTERKKWSALATAIALLGEMMRWLHVMYSSTEQTEQIMALGLMDRLFYSNEPLDRLPRLFAKWEPGTTSRKCLGDLVEVSMQTFFRVLLAVFALSDQARSTGRPLPTAVLYDP